MIPFTLPLLYGSSGYTQPVSLGIDAGTQHIGISASTEKAVLFEAEVKPRQEIQEVLATRRQFRHARRQRKTRFRQARSLNRKKPEGWLAPSIQHKVQAHLKGIRLVHRILPVRITTIEVAQFDIQKIRNPEIEATEYQEGAQLGFWCVRYHGQICFVFGRRSSGYFDLRTLDGTKVYASASSKTLTSVQKATAMLIERRAAFPPSA